MNGNSAGDKRKGGLHLLWVSLGCPGCLRQRREGVPADPHAPPTRAMLTAAVPAGPRVTYCNTIVLPPLAPHIVASDSLQI